MNLLESMIKSSVMGQEPKSWPAYNSGFLNRAAYLTASEAGKCIRELSFSKLDEFRQRKWDLVKTDEQFAALVASQSATSPDGYFERGHNVEAWVVYQILEMAEEHEHFFFLGEDQVSFYDPRDKISGTPDGFLYNSKMKEFWLLEFKSVGSQVYSPRADHLRQVQINMGLIRRIAQDKREKYGPELLKLMEEQGVELVNGKLPKWTGAKLLYTQASNYFDMKEFDIEYDGGETYRETQVKSKKLFSGMEDKIERLRRPAQLPAEGVKMNKCSFCPHQKECRNLVLLQEGEEAARAIEAKHGIMPLPDFKSSKTNSELVTLVGEFASLDIQIKELTSQKDELKPEVAPFILNKCDGKLVGEHGDIAYRVSVRESKGRTSLDKDAMGQDGINLEKYEKVGNPYFTTTVKAG